MDLTPYVMSDPAFNIEDFFPSVWQSAQWDHGIWYIPVSASVSMLVYDRTAFDEAGLSYPDERWTLDDFDHAVRALTSYDQDGKVTVPGFQLYNPGLFYYGLTGQPFYDVNASVSTPHFNNPDLITFYEQWRALAQDIAVTGENRFDFSQIPLQFGVPWQLENMGNGDEHSWETSLLPGGVTSLSIEGFAVSNGTINPELAYALANFASTDPQIIDGFGGDTPSHRSLLESTTDSSKDIQGIEQALEKAVPISELRFQDYLEVVVNQSNDDEKPFDMQAAVQQAELNAINALDTADARHNNPAIYVITPVPTPSMTENQIIIRFGLGLDTSLNQDAWTELINDFLADNPSVGNVEIDNDFFDPKDRTELDCYYQPYNTVPSLDQANFLSMDPLMDADPTFDRNDFIGNVLDQVKRDNRIWAYPIMIQPSVLWYDADLFARAGLPSPEQGWTVDDFDNALKTLHGLLDQETNPVFASETYGNTYLLMLIAAYGGLPYDYQTIPPTVNLTDPATVAAIRQVLDLARSGYIGYQSLAGISGGE
ncbi:MAG TPA: extracellular solute-binding protein, partial [Phototrophicaceae bacterium]|nr:extracellular solute-binding protein [Phototrophicaceae bacterium]